VRASDPEGVVRRLQAGDPEAVRELYGRYGRSVFAVALHVLGRRDLAEDATQQTFVQVWQHAASLDPGRDPGPWLHTVARRMAIAVLRKERPDRTVALGASEARLAAPEDDTVTRTWEVWKVRGAVDGLPAEERDTLRLAHFEGLSHSETATKLGVPIGTVKSRMARAYRRLAGELGRLRDDEALL
jgi:RNA polymerase sigma factor (sigma-70 family)